MTILRDGPYVWVTWLSRLMAGEVQCQWAPWFRTHYTGYTRAPSNFNLAMWTVEHNQLIDELHKEHSVLGEAVYKEVQNHFRVKRPSGLIIAGKPDLITIDQSGHCTVYDIKTGNPRQGDIIQVMLYMMFLPYALALYKGKYLSGCVLYKACGKSEIPVVAIDDDFRSKVTYFLDILESSKPPERTVSAAECSFCDITSDDCPDRKDLDDMDSGQNKEAEIPL